MEEETFGVDDLNKCDDQYLIRHTKTNCFSAGETVFLKSNPEYLMTVHSLSENDVVCTWKSMDGQLQLALFPPECILQYKYRCLVECKEKFKICLN